MNNNDDIFEHYLITVRRVSVEYFKLFEFLKLISFNLAFQHFVCMLGFINFNYLFVCNLVY